MTGCGVGGALDGRMVNRHHCAQVLRLMKESVQHHFVYQRGAASSCYLGLPKHLPPLSPVSIPSH